MLIKNQHYDIHIHGQVHMLQSDAYGFNDDQVIPKKPVHGHLSMDQC